jgi:hypothetical protein
VNNLLDQRPTKTSAAAPVTNRAIRFTERELTLSVV